MIPVPHTIPVHPMGGVNIYDNQLFLLCDLCGMNYGFQDNTNDVSKY